MFKDICTMFGRYNAWANERLYAAAGDLSDEEFAEDRGAFFGGMAGTLNHILVADRIWMRRFTGAGSAPTSLAAILHEDLATLQEERRAEDARIARWVEGLSEADLAMPFTYRTVTNPADITQTLGPALAHVFNHQTHHRGQAHAILTGFGRDAPSLDLIMFQRETGIGLT